jgi:hypothetical protein
VFASAASAHHSLITLAQAQLEQALYTQSNDKARKQ